MSFVIMFLAILAVIAGYLPIIHLFSGKCHFQPTYTYEISLAINASAILEWHLGEFQEKMIQRFALLWNSFEGFQNIE